MIELQNDKRERAIAVAVAADAAGRAQAEEYLEELSLLADTAGADIVRKVLQTKGRSDPTYYIGKGKVEEVARLVEEDAADLVIFDDDLSPAQMRNLEKVINRKVVDRSGLILDIFASRAKTNEAKTQVELAQLEYMLPRLTRLWTHLSKQYGGIRTKGPGETQIETDRRIIRTRIASLKEKLERIATQRQTRRKGREELFNVSLVGYTNAGKSTLLNTLSHADVFVEDRLFATLDPTTRVVKLEEGTSVLVTDTVGFIRKLPHHLVASFKSTLEETTEADLLLHVIDITHPYMADHIQVVQKTIEELGAGDKPVMYTFNKIDRLKDRTVIKDLQSKYSPAIFLSAQRGINILGLKEALLAAVRSSFEELTFTIGNNDYRLLSRIHDLSDTVNETYDEQGIHVVARVNAANAELVKRLVKEVRGE
jgi:GTP-binding protein HflX